MKKLIKIFLHCTNHLIERVGGWETSCTFKWEKNKDKDDTSSSQIPLFFDNAILEYYVRAIPTSTALARSTIVAVGFSFFFLLSGSHGKRWWKTIVAVWLHSNGQQLWLFHTVNNCCCGLLFFLSFVRVTWKKAVKKAAKEFETHVISYGLGNVCHKGTLINFYLKKF